MQKHERDHVRDHHDTVKEVREGPDKIDMGDCAQDQESANNDSIDKNSAAMEKVADVLFTEEVLTDNRGIGEKEQTDRHKTHTRTA